jgi:hypothetical protein
MGFLNQISWSDGVLEYWIFETIIPLLQYSIIPLIRGKEI